ncbi:hypothetical protein [Sphingomonas aerophila]|uniref:hypothetical protein n=1 Tax=Sphingomonas aerophila TaxID=1344948 RepID=UPI0016150638|nr:hypothetical protein [Sphingomonas aerophila]
MDDLPIELGTNACKRLLLSHNVEVVAVHKRAVDVEQDSLDGHKGAFRESGMYRWAQLLPGRHGCHSH